MEVVDMIKFFSKIYKESGIGATHIVTRTGKVTILRWGFWTPYLTILFSKILPVKQTMHNHEGTFLSILLKGQYQEIIKHPNKDSIEINFNKWFNFLNYKEYHEIKATKPVYTLLLMGIRRNIPSFIINDKIVTSKVLLKRYR
jgi:hypothetical protein